MRTDFSKYESLKTTVLEDIEAFFSTNREPHSSLGIDGGLWDPLSGVPEELRALAQLADLVIFADDHGETNDIIDGLPFMKAKALLAESSAAMRAGNPCPGELLAWLKSSERQR